MIRVLNTPKEYDILGMCSVIFKQKTHRLRVEEVAWEFFFKKMNQISKANG